MDALVEQPLEKTNQPRGRASTALEHIAQALAWVGHIGLSGPGR